MVSKDFLQILPAQIVEILLVESQEDIGEVRENGGDVDEAHEDSVQLMRLVRTVATYMWTFAKSMNALVISNGLGVQEDSGQPMGTAAKGTRLVVSMMPVRTAVSP